MEGWIENEELSRHFLQVKKDVKKRKFENSPLISSHNQNQVQLRKRHCQTLFNRSALCVKYKSTAFYVFPKSKKQ